MSPKGKICGEAEEVATSFKGVWTATKRYGVLISPTSSSLLGQASVLEGLFGQGGCFEGEFGQEIEGA